MGENSNHAFWLLVSHSARVSAGIRSCLTSSQIMYSSVKNHLVAFHLSHNKCQSLHHDGIWDPTECALTSISFSIFFLPSSIPTSLAFLQSKWSQECAVHPDTSMALSPHLFKILLKCHLFNKHMEAFIFFFFYDNHLLLHEFDISCVLFHTSPLTC